MGALDEWASNDQERLEAQPATHDRRAEKWLPIMRRWEPVVIVVVALLVFALTGLRGLLVSLLIMVPLYLWGRRTQRPA